MADKYKFRAGYVSLTGLPNVGKSTLMNAFVGMDIAITSPKPQTTRRQVRAVYTSERAQVVFVDTPGIHKAKNALGEFMFDAACSAWEDVDLVLMLVEPSKSVRPGEAEIFEALKARSIPVILCINKCDTIKKAELLGVIDRYSSCLDFKEIIPISARTGEGLKDLMDTLVRYLPEGEPFYDEDTVTDETERDMVEEIIRQSILRKMSDEIPHGVAVVVESMKFKRDLCRISADIICEKKSHKGMIIGRNGSMIKELGSASRAEIEKLLDKKVMLELFVKVRDKWRDNESMIRAFGYKKQ